MPAMVVEGVGYGVGHRRLASGPNLLRVVLGSEPAVAGSSGADPADAGRDRVVLLETIIDDASPEVLGYLFERLRREGALEVWWSPAYMKKARPAVHCRCSVRVEDEQRLVDIVFAESGTFGVRRALVERHVLARSWVTVQVEGMQVRVKVGRRGDGEWSPSRPSSTMSPRSPNGRGARCADVMQVAARPRRVRSVHLNGRPT